MIFVDSLHISLKKSWPFGKIFYTLDGTEPTKESAEYTHAILVTNNGTIKSVFILDNGRTSKIKSGSFTKTSPLRSRDVKGVPGKGLNYRYFEGSISSIANFDKLDYKNSGFIDIVGLPETSNQDAFGLNLEGLIKIPQTGVYTFKLVSDDGSQMFIDGQLVVDADGLHGPEPKSGQVALEKGFHKILVKYFEAGGGERLEGYIQGPGIDNQTINEDFLYHKENY